MNFTDKRYFLYRHLKDFISFDKKEEESRLAIIKFLENNENCFDRTCIPGHITGSSFVVSEDFSEVLLNHHMKLDKWIQFGGHSDGEANPFNVALRETFEESGLPDVKFIYPYTGIFCLDHHPIPAHKGEPDHIHYDVRIILMAKRSAKLKVSSESKEIKWIKIEDIEKYNSEVVMQRMIKKALAIKSTLQ
ncbi:MAG: NUDIX hydrolase [bacterium]